MMKRVEKKKKGREKERRIKISDIQQINLLLQLLGKTKIKAKIKTLTKKIEAKYSSKIRINY